MGGVLKERAKFPALAALALLAVAALLLPSLGPLLDHHFAERHPGHTHWYRGAAGPEHSHPFEQFHIHYDAMYDAMYAPADGGEIVFFTRQDGAGHSCADLVAPGPAPRLRLDGDGAPMLRSGADEGGVRRGVSVAPATRPPNA